MTRDPHPETPQLSVSPAGQPRLNGRVKSELQARVRSAVADAFPGGDGGGLQITRVQVQLERVDPLLWLAAQPFDTRFYWRGRSDDQMLAATGVADECAGEYALEDLAIRLEELDGLASDACYVGGMRFAPNASPDARWQSYGAAHFVLPRFELRTGATHSTLSVNIVSPRDDLGRVLADIDELRIAPARVAMPLPLAGARTDAPDQEAWCRAVRAILSDLESGYLEKVVLARRVTFAFGEPLDPVALLHHLQAATPSSFHFLIQFGSTNDAFLGAAPERLFCQEGRRVWTEAVAGTRPRKSDPAADQRLRDDLLSSDKDRREHDFVRERILAALRPLCAAVESDATEAMGLASKWHLRTAIRGGLRSDASPVDVLRALHPTPAVGGTPTEEALARIASLEPFDRGWYAGPVGWIGARQADFAVGIRSGLIRATNDGSELDLFSGAGIVRGSDPAAEWAEIEDKIIDFARVLGLDD